MWEALAGLFGLLLIIAGAVIKSMDNKRQQAEKKAEENALKYASLLEERDRGWADNRPSSVFNAAEEAVRPSAGRPVKRGRGHNPFQ